MTKEKKNAVLPLLVGIGSSAGGLEALRELATSLPTDNGCAYVIVQHMSPQHKSLMTSLIASETDLRVLDIIDKTVPEPDVIYVTPPRADVVMSKGMLRLLPPSEEMGKPKPSVDRFLISLAQDRGERSMGIILSGTGSDGAYGIQAVREAGGITIAQDDDSAKYDGMPKAAIATGCIDLVLRPSDIALHLKKIVDSPRNLEQFRSDDGDSSPVSAILQIVLARTRVDFREYKQSTVLRRIDRRMTALGIATVEEYVVHCRNEPREVDALFKDLLISVTRFFRDREEFEDLQKHIQELVDLRNERPLRIWVAGCATGEEVYTIAILLAEAMGGAAELVRSKTQIFATDIDRAALDYARKGQYSQGALLDVPKVLSDKYFIQQSEGVRVIEALRSVVLFSDHNLCQDPPFLNMDLICCRNLLIYFSGKLQSRVFSRLHYAMKQSGYLFLGTAESVTGSDQLFTEVADNPHIFRKLAQRKKDQVASKAFQGTWTSSAGARQKLPSSAPPPDIVPTERLMFDALARSLGENSILVSADHSFLRVYGDITPYVNLSEDSSLNLQLSLLKSPYREEARSLVTLALKHDQRRMGTKHSLIEDQDRLIRLEAIPIQAPSIDERLALMVINSWSKADYEKISGAPTDTAAQMTDDHLRELDQELATTREALQQTIEELETSNEELQALNEELQSTNEELQATNEELETSNEELQSTNEELITVNEELQVNSSELMGLNAELASLLGNVPVPLLVLDNALQIARASHAAMQLFNISEPLRNPHLSQIHLPDGFPRLVEFCNEALKLGQPVNNDFTTDSGPYTLQCAPFTGDGGQMIGTTLVFLQSPPAIQSLANELNQLLTNAPVYLLQHDEGGLVTRLSNGMADLLGLDVNSAIETPVDTLLAKAKISKENGLRTLLNGETHDDPIPLRQLDGSIKWLAAMRHAYTDPSTGQMVVVILGTDITDMVGANEMIDMSNRSLDLMEDISDTGYWRVDLDADTLHWSERVYEIHGQDPESYSPTLEEGINAYHEDDRQMVTEAIERAIQEGAFNFKARLIQKDGTAIWVHSMGETTKDPMGKVIAIVGSFRDITDEIATHRRLTEIETLVDRQDIGFYSYDILTDVAYWSPSAYRLLRVDPNTEATFALIHSMVTEEDQPRFKQHRERTIAKGRPYQDDFKLTAGNGSRHIMTIDMSASKNTEGQVSNYFGAITLKPLEGKPKLKP